MFLYVLGYQPPAGFVEGGGILSSPTPVGPNLVSVHEERFAENHTFQIGTQLERVRRGIGPGDVPILHTGWTHLVRDAPTRYLAQEPGIYLAEARWFADRRPAIIASDTWGLEVLSPAVTGGNAFPCHQELLGKHGIRIGEGYVTDAAIAENVFEGVIVITPQNVPGATCGSTPPVLLGQPGRRPPR